ncbi:MULTISPECIES: hypothetical protein [Bacillus]|uniref:hypothetical protein n=1 Tax=Bacillus TaxID=1386 RepID=UPI0007A0B6C6|nr:MULTISPECIES: hypothetical protein [Bacillus]KYZ65850.1 hypothetical protein A3782_24280 [Bacillus sp. GZT]
MNNSFRMMAFDTLVKLIKSDNNLNLEFMGKINRLRFAPKEFDLIEKVGDGSWDGTKYIILFELENRPDRLDVLLIIGPGNEDIRQRLFNHVLQCPEVFNSVSRRNLSPIFKRVFRKKLIDYNGDIINEEKLRETIISAYNDFKEHDYKKIVNYIKYNYK